MKHWYDQYFLFSKITTIWLSGYTSQVKKKDFLSRAPNILQVRRNFRIKLRLVGIVTTCRMGCDPDHWFNSN